jgi:hypothetical protein
MVLPRFSRYAGRRPRRHPACAAGSRQFWTMPWREIGAVTAALRRQAGLSARALEFTILTAAGSSDTRHCLSLKSDAAG